MQLDKKLGGAWLRGAAAAWCAVTQKETWEAHMQSEGVQCVDNRDVKASQALPSANLSLWTNIPIAAFYRFLSSSSSRFVLAVDVNTKQNIKTIQY